MSILVLNCIFNFIQKSSKLDVSHMTMTAIWLGFNAQMLISPNQIGLTVWGWAFGGALISYPSSRSLIKSVNLSEGDKSRNLSNSRVSTNDFSPTIAWIVGTLCALIVSLPLYLANAQFRSALVSSNALKIIEASKTWPQNPTTIVYTSKLLFANNLMEQGYELANYGLSKYPNSFELKRVILNYNKLTESDRREIKLQLKKLDPLNDDL